MRKEYRGHPPVTAVAELSLTVEPGAVVGLLGVNGAGKTTTIKCAAALVTPTAGTVTVGADDITARPIRAAQTMSVLLEGNRNVYWRLSVQENLEYTTGLAGRSRRDATKDIVALVDRLGLGEKRRVEARKLSRGMQQKLAVAAALVRRTPFLMLDEPTLGLDVLIGRELRMLLREEAASRGVGVLFSSHDMAAVQDLCDRVVVLAKGRVVADGRVADLLALFRAQAYTVTALPLDASARDRLTARFPLITLTDHERATEVRVELTAPADVYELFDVLRAGGATVTGVRQEEPDLETAFLHLIGDQP